MMTMLTRWEPFRELPTLREMMERFWDEPFDLLRTLPRTLGEFRPAMDVSEDEGAYIVKASLPGVKPEEVEVTLSDNVLTLKGEAKQEKETKEENYHLRERRFGSFMRSITLPMAVKSEKVEATHENGVITLRLPKSEEVKPKKIAVKSVGNGKQS
jgi:HSP20 family protein